MGCWLKYFALTAMVLSANFPPSSAQGNCEKWACDIKADSCKFPSEDYHNRCVNDKDICRGGSSGEKDICNGQTNEPDDHYFCNPKMEGHSEIDGSKPWAKCDVNTCFAGGEPKEFGSSDERCKIEVKKCLLPFMHNGKRYDKCTDDLIDPNNQDRTKESFKWCATLLNPDGTMKQDRWAVCNEASCRCDDEPLPKPGSGIGPGGIAGIILVIFAVLGGLGFGVYAKKANKFCFGSGGLF